VRPWLPALLDWGALAFQRSGPAPLLVALAVIFGAIQVYRLLRGRRRTPRAKRPAASRPPRDLEDLLVGLRQLGWPRGQGESLEAYARRLSVVTSQLESRGSDALLRAADRLLRRYAALRYGGLGSADALRRDVRDWLCGSTRDRAVGDHRSG
jgi:hypothetical protein